MPLDGAEEKCSGSTSAVFLHVSLLSGISAQLSWHTKILHNCFTHGNDAENLTPMLNQISETEFWVKQKRIALLLCKAQPGRIW